MNWTEEDFKIKALLVKLLHHKGCDPIVLGAIGSWKEEQDDQTVLSILEQDNSAKPFEVVASVFIDHTKN